MAINSPIHTHNTKIGTCPHGLPQGACPICNGMAGGNSTNKRDIPRNPGEMTYNQCLAMGAMLRAQKNAKKQAQISQQNYLQALANVQKAITMANQKLAQFSAFISKTMPAVIAKPINFVINNVIVRLFNGIKNIPNFIGNLAKNIVQTLTDLTSKLTAIFGEIKASVQKTISEFWNKTKKKLKSVFFIFGADNDEDSDKKIDETKKAFNLKSFIQKLTVNLNKKEEKTKEKEESI